MSLREETKITILMLLREVKRERKASRKVQSSRPKIKTLRFLKSLQVQAQLGGYLGKCLFVSEQKCEWPREQSFALDAVRVEIVH